MSAFRSKADVDKAHQCPLRTPKRTCHRFTLGLMPAMVFSMRRVAPSPRCVYRHILCHQSAQHAADPCRDTVARSQVLFRARRSTSTGFRSTRISPRASRPSRSQDRPQARGYSHRGDSRHGMSCPAQPCCRLQALAGNHRGIRCRSLRAPILCCRPVPLFTKVAA